MNIYLNFRKSLSMVAIIAIVQGCYIDPFRETVYGEGPVIKKAVDTEYFTGIRVSSGIDVFLRQDENLGVVVEADENLHEYIHHEVRNGILIIDTEVNIRQAKSKKVYISLPELREIQISSAGDVEGQGKFTCRKLDISVSSAGDLSLEVEAGEIRVSLSSAGDIRLSGKADSLEARLSSAGDLDALRLKVEKADVAVSSSGNARIFVTRELNARSSSSGDIYYLGNPEIKNIHVSSAGRVKSL
ncbi:MAG TPA: DUF2807 domain-containing protein [Bacteroidetes bacterium]|nr:DUF2807 domain-containing protein [Bacteroidota bacterium]